MKKSFSARRVPRRIGQDEEGDTTADNDGEQSAEPTIKRPSSKPRKGSSLKNSFGPTAVEDDELSEPSGIITPKRQNLSRVAIQRNASKRSALLASSLPTRDPDEDDDRPSYSATSLQELKASTPSTPHDLSTDTTNSDVDDVSSHTQALDLTSKFGTSLSRYQAQQHFSAIPSASEIAEKKARRARLAKEQAAEDFISLDLDDPELDNDDNVMQDDYGRLVLKPKDKYNEAESRLVRDDEDIMEDFDDFTEADSKILMGRKAEVEATRQRKKQMATQIAEAEGASESDSDASERERTEAFEAAQTKHGTYTSHQTSNDPYADVRPKTPPKISPLPTLDGVIERLRNQVMELQTSRMQKLQEMEALQREKIRLGEEEVRVQRALRETGEKFKLLREEKGITAVPARDGTPALEAGDGMLTMSGGLGFRTDGENEGGDEALNGGHAGLGFGLGSGMAGRGLESLGTSAVGTPARVMEDSDGAVDPDEMIE